jgi:CheY-like chemotaxis protein/nitrogen-specific signal transduction histidine kinase
MTMLVSAVRGALRARARQYQTRDLLTELEQADKQKDLFLATLSHELRTPLNSILGWIQLARGGGREGDLTHALDVIERNAKNQSELISDILLISRVITGKLELTLEPIDIVSAIQAAFATVSPSAKEKNIRLSLGTSAGSIEVSGDAERLQQIFGNLLSNAVKFTPEQGKIDVTIGQSGGSVVVEIRDNGSGIEPDVLPYIFERFRQADNSYSRTIGGLGLGLAIVRHLLELHHGTISAESAGPGQGSSFTVTLPIAAERKVSGPQTKESSKNGDREFLKDVKILLVEDDKDSRDMLAITFGLYGMEVMTAASALEALEAMRSFQPEILVSDLGLPGEDGFSLIRKIRSLPAGQGNAIPAIALTGYVSLQDQAIARRSGYQEHISKPVDIENLADVIYRLLKKKPAAE